jgi:hypothetical protein
LLGASSASIVSEPARNPDRPNPSARKLSPLARAVLLAALAEAVERRRQRRLEDETTNRRISGE